MDRLSQLRGEAGSSKDSTLDASSPPSEAFMTANESSSKYFSLSDVDSTFDISPIKDVSLATANMEPEKTVTESDQLISNLSPIGKKDFLDSYKIGKQIEAANILSGGVDIFDDNENSYDGDELVIDDNAEMDEKSNPDLKLVDSTEGTLVEAEPEDSKDTEVILQIDGKNVDAIDIGNGLYLYRKEGQEELAAVQIVDDDKHQPSFKFLKVRENAEGNLEVYEEIQIEVPKEVPMKEDKVVKKNVSHVPIKDINKVISDSTGNKVAERKVKTQNIAKPAVLVSKETETNKETHTESKSEPSKKIKFSESRKSPVIGSFTPMTFHSTPNKEGIPLTKTMVDQHLHPSRHSDNIKKTIEVHTDSAKQRIPEQLGKTKDVINDDKNKPVVTDEKDTSGDNSCLIDSGLTNKDLSEKNIEAGVIKDDVIIEDKNLIIDEKVIEIEKEQDADPGKDLNCTEKPQDKLTESSSDKKCLELSAVAENELNEALTPEDDKMVIVEEIELPASGNEQPEEIVSMKTEPETTKVENSNINEQNPAKESKDLISKDESKIELVKENMVAAESDTESAKKESDVISVRDITCNEIAADTQSKPCDEVDSKLCADQTEKQIDQKINNMTGDIAIQENHNKLDHKKIEPVIEETDEKLKSEIEEKAECNSNIQVNTKTIEIIAKKSEACAKESEATPLEPEITPSIQPDNPIESKVTSEKDVSPDKTDIKPKLPQIEPNVTQVDKECKPVNSIPSSKPDLPNTDVSSKSETKAQTNIIEKGQKEIKANDIKPILGTQSLPLTINASTDKKAIPIVVSTDSKPINNNHAPVPFGKWTEANRQAFLNKIKITKVPTNSSNGKQIKNSNDLNRRDVLKKIDSQRQSSIASAKAQEFKMESHKQSTIDTAKAQDFGSANRMGVKKEAAAAAAAALAKKTPLPQDPKLPTATSTTIKIEAPKNNSAPLKKTKQETIVKPPVETAANTAIDFKKESKQRKEINNQDLIDKTIEEIINRPAPAISLQEEQAQRCFDEIEMKMNELHGKPFIERPIHELPPQKVGTKTYPKQEYQKPTVSKPSKIPNLLPFSKTQQKSVKENTIEIDSEEEVIIEHEPITGDMDLNQKKTTKLVVPEKLPVTNVNVDPSKKEAIITEKDFDKFVRRNSISYENCFTVNFDGKEPHNVIQSVVQKDIPIFTPIKTYSKLESSQHDAKVVSPRKRELFFQNNHQNAGQNIKFGPTIMEDDGKNYQSKVKMAYQTAMTAKRQMERPITIIEDKPVKVVYMDTNTEFISNQLNVQGKELSPAKKLLKSVESVTTLTTDSLDSDNTLDSIEEEKTIDDTKFKTKHQRKQVLTPVETPEFELIEPHEIGAEVSPKKKRKTEDKTDKNMKTLVPKKSYLLGRGNTLEDLPSKTYDFTKSSQRDTLSQDSSHITHKNTASAIDSLVKAAELLETQSGNLPAKAPDTPSSDSQQNTPVKRGRGRPRKNPLPDGTTDKTKVPSPQKKPRLIDAKVVKSKYTDDDSSTDEDVIVKENWTMGKINKHIICPICNKLFRSENVVFKHVKHCTGPSPSRSDSENKSPRRFRESQESESMSYESRSDDMEMEDNRPSPKDVRKKRKSKDSQHKTFDKDDVIVIEDTPLKGKPDKQDETKPAESKKTISKTKLPDKLNSLVCEFCGKTFRQLSYLVSHKLQHSKEDIKKHESEPKTNKSVFSCEVCKKEFRKLHHLVQHRIIHNPSNVSAKMSRKSSSEQHDNKVSKDHNALKQSEDPSAGFRCEPCDKSFRKLHHLVEHRETHDGINRQKNTSTVQTNAEKLPPPPQCDICKKTFRKLHHLIEHREQHVETSSEKSDDKSIKSSLSTKDIIHECSLCYMVFPNEHSLNKHTIICQRKKRQSATKQIKQAEENEAGELDAGVTKIVEDKTDKADDDVAIVADEAQIVEVPATELPQAIVEEQMDDKMEIEDVVIPTPLPAVISESLKPNVETDKTEDNKPLEPIKSNPPKIEVTPDLPLKMKKPDVKEVKPKVQDPPRKKTPMKDKVAPTVTKRHKPNLPVPVIETPKPAESSDDDEARYMLNPDYKFEDTEGKLFMKVRANKRNSLQIERPNSKDLVTRRISLQHPLKVPRLKAKAIPYKPVTSNPTTSAKTVPKAPKLEPVPSSDSDDSDVKYSFPKNSTEEVPSSNLPETSLKDPVKKIQRKSLADKRKSLSSIAKRKSLGKAVGAKHKVKPSPAKQVRKRTAEVEHRCDCGQLFSSAALLSRHTTLAHTPPRIRRRRSPPPDETAKTIVKPAPRKSNLPSIKPRPSADSRKSSVKSEANVPTQKPTQPTKRKSSTGKVENKTPNKTRKSPKSSEKTDVKAPSNVKLRRYAAHKGVPVPEKMRKLMEKSKK